MQDNPLISVIIPIYKVEKYLKKCVDSVLGQSYKNLEIILVDDGSPDSCPKICDEYSIMDDRIKVIHKKNGGLSDARNAGLDASIGEYIVFVDSDDFIDSKMIESLFEAAVDSDADLVICDYSFVDETGMIQKNYPSLKEEIIDSQTALNYIYQSSGVRYIVAWNKLYKRYIFDDLRFDVGKIHEDEFIIHKVLLKSKRIKVLSDSYYYYLSRSDSIMGKGYSVKSLDYIEALFDRYLYFDEHKMDGLRNITKKRILDEYALSKLYFKPNSKIEKARAKEIRKNVKYVFFNSKNTVKSYFVFCFPKLYYRAYKIYSGKVK